ncbi:EamA family transporter [Sedimenticola sp.]|uniref:EamA family transporter n=1 Tax=Sedimenticola sp. TaxID=1940285 RepID=UPI003D11DD65
MLAWFFLLATIVLTVSSQVLQKQVALAAWPVSRGNRGRLIFYRSQPRFWLALLCLAAAMMCWLVVLDVMEVSRAYTWLSVNYVLMLPISRLLFGENIPPTRWLGVLIIVAGLSLLAWS